MSAKAQVKSHQISVRIASETDAWLEKKAGGSRKKAAFVRRLIERAQKRERHEALRQMFDEAAEDLGPEDYEERDKLLGAFDGGDEAEGLGS